METKLSTSTDVSLPALVDGSDMFPDGVRPGSHDCTEDVSGPLSTSLECGETLCFRLRSRSIVLPSRLCGRLKACRCGRRLDSVACEREFVLLLFANLLICEGQSLTARAEAKLVLFPVYGPYRPCLSNALVTLVALERESTNARLTT